MKNALLLCPLLALAACASSDSMVKTSKKAQPDPHKLARTSDCITESLVTGFQGLDTRHLLLYGSGGRKVFLVEIAPACFDLKTQNTLQAVDGDRNNQICGYGQDSIVYETFGRVESCRILGMEELNDARRAELLAK